MQLKTVIEQRKKGTLERKTQDTATKETKNANGGLKGKDGQSWRSELIRSDTEDEESNGFSDVELEQEFGKVAYR